MQHSTKRALAILLAFSPLAVLATDHASALTKPPTKPKHKTNDATPSPTPCATPTMADCKNVNYLVGACGERADSKATCKNLLGNQRKPIHGKKFYRATASKFDIDSAEWVDDKFTPYTPGATAAQSGGGSSYAARLERDRMTLVKPGTNMAAFDLSLVRAATYAAYEKDGDEVHSCDEYVYKYYYDWIQFENQAAACGSDHGCVADLALGNRKGQKLAGLAGVGNGLRQKSPTAGTLHGPMPSSALSFDSWYYRTRPAGILGPYNVSAQKTQFSLITGDLPKNPWFNGGVDAWMKPAWMASVLGQQFAADFQALAAAATDGRVYYNLSNQSAVVNGATRNEVFADEWAFHKHLRQKTLNVPDEQVKAIKHRTALAQALLDAAGTPGHNPYFQFTTVIPESITKWTWGVDPYENLGDYGSQERTEAHYARRRHERRGGTPDTVKNNVSQSAAQIATQVQSNNTTPAAGTWKADKPSPNGAPQFLCTPATTPILVMPGATQEEGIAAGMARCQYMNLYLDEWWRNKNNSAKGCKDNANCGCLHIDAANNSAACDWSPETFYDRWVAPHYYQAARQQALAYCSNFGNVTPNGQGPAGAPLASETKNLGGYDDYMARGEKAMADLGQIPYRPGAKHTSAPELKKADWGQIKQQDGSFGDKSWFAGSYDAEAGWELRPVALIPSSPKRTDAHGTDLTGQVCAMTGELYGVFQANAWIFGSQINAVDGDAWLVLNDTKTVPANDTGGGGPVPATKNLGDRDIHYEAHLIVLGDQLFATPKTGTGNVFARYENGSAPASQYTTAPATQPVTLGSSHDSWNIPDPQPEIPFTIGPIPCYISGYAELALDVEASAQFDLPSDCTAPVGSPGHKFGPTLSVTPSASLAGIAEAGVGISGIASVGIRGELTLIDLHLPATTSLTIDAPTDKDPNLELDFKIGVDGSLTTLGGSLSVYFQLLFFDEEAELFSWDGLGPYRFTVVPTFETKVPLPAVRSFVTGNAGQSKSGW